jgi:hypothetical protein
LTERRWNGFFNPIEPMTPERYSDKSGFLIDGAAFADEKAGVAIGVKHLTDEEGVVFASVLTTTSELLRTEDGGGSWSKVPKVVSSAQTIDVRKVPIDPPGSSVVPAPTPPDIGPGISEGASPRSSVVAPPINTIDPGKSEEAEEAEEAKDAEQEEDFEANLPSDLDVNQANLPAKPEPGESEPKKDADSEAEEEAPQPMELKAGVEGPGEDRYLQVSLRPSSEAKEIWVHGANWSYSDQDYPFLMCSRDGGETWRRWDFPADRVDSIDDMEVTGSGTVWCLVSLESGESGLLIADAERGPHRLGELPSQSYSDLLAAPGGVVVQVQMGPSGYSEASALGLAEDLENGEWFSYKNFKVVRDVADTEDLFLVDDGVIVINEKSVFTFPKDFTVHSFASDRDGDELWAYGTGGAACSREESRLKWHRISGLGPVEDLGFNDEIGWAVSEGKLLLTRDHGDTWDDPRIYRKLPSPAALSSFALGLVLLVPAFRKPPEKKAAEASIANIYLSDAPLEKADGELGVLANGVARFLKNENTGAPLVMAVCGPWGGGKSSLMLSVKKDLVDSGFSPVWFNAWHHEDEEHFFAALMQSIRADAIPAVFSWHGLAYRYALALKRYRRRWVYVALLMMLAALLISLVCTVGLDGLALDFADGTALMGSLLKLLPFGAAVAPFIALLRMLSAFGVDPAKLAATAASGAKAADVRKQTSSRHQFAMEFGEVTEALHPKRMVIFVDDLDRCDPAHMVKVLQAINFLSVSGKCFVVMGMEKRAVLGALAEKLGAVAERLPEEPGVPKESKEDYAKRWIEKLVQVEVNIPRMEDKEKRRIAGAPDDQEDNTAAGGGESAASKEPRTPLKKRLATAGLFAAGALPLLLACGAIWGAWWLGREKGGEMKAEASRKERVLVGQRQDELRHKQEEEAAKLARKEPQVWNFEGKWESLTSWRFTARNEAPEEKKTSLLDKKEGPLLADNGVPPEGEDKTEEAEEEDYEVVDFGPPPAPQALATSIVEVRPAKGSMAYVLWSILGGLLALIGGGMARSRIKREREEVVRDSRDFRDAVNAWWPQIDGRHKTPRSLKRFVNRLRLYASLVGEAGTTKPEIGEKEIVGFGVMEDVCPAVLRKRLPAMAVDHQPPVESEDVVVRSLADLGDREKDAKDLIAKLGKSTEAGVLRRLMAALRT